MVHVLGSPSAAAHIDNLYFVMRDEETPTLIREAYKAII